MEKLDSALYQWIVLYSNYFNFEFSYLHAFYKPKNIKTKPTKKLKLIFKFSTIMGQINILHFGPTWGIKRWRKDGKTFIRCYTIALKLWDEFNANFVLLYFSTYSSIKMWHLFLKNVEKNKKAMYLRLVLTYLFKNLSILRNILPGHSKKLSICFFYVFVFVFSLFLSM